jgi:putative tricarboxylic transport membrane protein
MRGRAWALGFPAASAVYLGVSLTFPLGDVAKPGPGFYPVGVGIFLAVAAAALAASLLRGLPVVAAVGQPLPAGGRARVAATLGGLVAFALLLPWIGYALSAFVFVAVVLRYLGGGRWPAALLVAAGAAAVSQYGFGVLLGVPLPRGPF